MRVDGYEFGDAFFIRDATLEAVAAGLRVAGIYPQEYNSSSDNAFDPYSGTAFTITPRSRYQFQVHEDGTVTAFRQHP